MAEGRGLRLLYVAQVRTEFPQAAKGKVEITYLYVADESDKLLGVVDSKGLLLAQENASWTKS